MCSSSPVDQVLLLTWQLSLSSLSAGCSSLVVMCLTAVWEDQGSTPTMGNCRFFIKTTTIYSLATHAITAVPRWTQPSTLRGMVKWVSAFGLSNTHSYIPTGATQTVICPTAKDKNGDLSDISNYRPIALATIFSKIFEHILLNRLYEYFRKEPYWQCNDEVEIL